MEITALMLGVAFRLKSCPNLKEGIVNDLSLALEAVFKVVYRPLWIQNSFCSAKK